MKLGPLSIHVGDIGSPNPRVRSAFLLLILRALRFSEHSLVEWFILLTIESNWKYMESSDCLMQIETQGTLKDLKCLFSLIGPLKATDIPLDYWCTLSPQIAWRKEDKICGGALGFMLYRGCCMVPRICLMILRALNGSECSKGLPTSLKGPYDYWIIPGGTTRSLFTLRSSQ